MRETFRSMRRTELSRLSQKSDTLRTRMNRLGFGSERGKTMGLKVPLALTAVVVAISSFSVPVWSDSTGFASMHDLRRERGRLCMSDHWHYGTSGPQKSKSKARRAAIRSWASFTATEYGSDWARWGRAKSKRASCSRASGSWDCSVEARPCR